MNTRRKPKPDEPRVALVTGAGKRIGRSIALALARDGWDIAVHYATSRTEAQATVASIEAMGRRAVAVNRDLAVERGVRSLLGECVEELGAVTCVVNNAAVFEYDTPTRFKPDLLAKHMRINTAAPVLLAQCLHAMLGDDERGVVINLLDQKLANPNPDFLSYTLSKSALCYATTVLAQALAPKVRVVGVAPGITLRSGTQSDAGFEDAHSRTPLGRSSTPEDIGNAVVYLASASAVTGATLLVDGGQHLVPSTRDVMFLTESE
jgi:NAD(P)-dependent dehydrogenase (short-subunit alcohol dehydrogenase family)